MTDFAPGDVVVIRDWDDMEQEFGLNRYGSIECKCSFTEEMRRFCGERVTIKSINERRIVKFTDYPEGMIVYNFSLDMIRHESDPASSVPEVPVSDFLSLIL